MRTADGYLWETRGFEERLKARLEGVGIRGQELWSEYIGARSRLVEDVLDQIRAIEPQLTDHGPKHVASVLDRIEQLLVVNPEYFCPIELYCLGMAALFHDVGNINGRGGHQNKIAEIFDFVRGQNPRVRAEKAIVLQAARAHCGESSAGSKDTIAQLVSREHMDSTPVRLREIAAVLRLADELAEGRNRTSAFMVAHHRFDEESRIFHLYASNTEILVDMARVAINYDIGDSDPVLPTRDGRIAPFLDTTAQFLEFAYKRIMKLDQERKYCRHYSPALEHLKETSVAFRFWINGEMNDLGLQPLSLTDKTVPGDPSRDIPDLYSAYEIGSLVGQLGGLLAGAR